MLIIEDDDDSREALRLQMEMWNNEVRMAATAEEALRAAEPSGRTSCSATSACRARTDSSCWTGCAMRLAGQRTVFAAVTGHARHHDEARALAAGYDSFLVKPLQPGSLARLLHSYAAGGAERAGR